MKKIIVAILLFILVVFVVNFEKHEPENTVIQSRNEWQNAVSNTEKINEIQENSLEGKTIAFIGDSLNEG